MEISDYLLKGVEWSEFIELKMQEEDIFSSVIGGISTMPRPNIRGLDPLFKYDLIKKGVVIYLGKQLVVRPENLDEPKRAFVQSLYSTLEQRLNKIREQESRRN